MSDYFSRALETPATPVQQPSGGGGPDYLSRALGASDTRTPSISDSQMVDDPNRRLGFIDQAKGSFAIDDDQWLGHAAKTLYPNDPNARARFGKTKEGQYYHVGDDGKPYAVQPQKGWSRLANAGAGVGAALPAVTGTMTGAAGLPFGGVPALATGAAGGLAGEVVRQTIGNYLMPEQKPIDPIQAIKEGVLSGAGQALGGTMNRAAARHVAPDIAYYNPQAAQQIHNQARSIGVRLTPAEATGLNSLVGEQKRLMASPRAANEMGRFVEGRNREVMGAWDNFVGSIAPPRDATALGREAADAATDVLTRAQAQRTAAVRPFYDQAERQIGTVNPGQIVQYIEQQLPTAKGPDRTALQYALQQLRRTGEDTYDMSFRGLDGAKKALDAVLENEDLATKTGIHRTAHGTLRHVRDMIVNAIDNAPGAAGIGGAPGPYAAGRTTYGVMSDAYVTPVQEVLAPLLRVNPANSSIVRTANAVLDPATRTPELVAQSRRLLESHYPQVWQGLKRQFMQEHAYAALQENAKGQVSNVGGNIAKRIGNDAVEANMRAAMTPHEFARYQTIVDVFRATGRAMDTNSDTAFKQEAIKIAKNEAGGLAATIFRNINPMQAARNAADFLSNANYEKKAEAIAKIYAQGDMDAIRALRALRQYGPTEAKRFAVLGAVLTRGGVIGIEEMLDLR